MIKNPQIGQTVFFFEDCKIKSGKINYIFHVSNETLAVEVNRCYYRGISQIYPTQNIALKSLKNEISKTLKSLNKEIKQLSKKREKLASKLADLISK